MISFINQSFRRFSANAIVFAALGLLLQLVPVFANAQVATITSIEEGEFLHAGSTITWAVDSDVEIRRWQITIGSKRSKPTGLFASKMFAGSDPYAVTVGQLPADGKPLFVRVSYQPKVGVWVRAVYEFLGTEPSLLANITTPAVGSELAAEQTFVWSKGLSLVEQWSINVGSKVGASDFLRSGVRSTSEPAPVVASVIANGKPVYARLFYRMKGKPWIRKDYVYQAPAPIEPEISLSPEPGSVLSGYDTISWSSNEISIKKWVVTVGRTKNRPSGIFSSGYKAGSVPFVTNLKKLPTDSKPLFLRLRYLSATGGWRQFDYEYQSLSPAQLAKITSPSAESVLSSSTVFDWQAGLSKIDEWYFSVGSKKARRDIFYSKVQSYTGDTPVEVEIPNNAKPVYVRLAYRYKRSSWHFIDTSYIAPPLPPKAVITSPITGSTLSPTTTFTWDSNGNNYDQWQITVGKTSKSPQGLFNSPIFNKTAPLSVTATHLPYNGNPLFVRLRYRLKGKSWTNVVSQYTAVDTIQLPEIASPTPGDTINPDASFTIADDEAVMYKWRFKVGSSSRKKSDIYSSPLFTAGDPLSIAIAIPAELTNVVVELSYKGKWTGWNQVRAEYEIKQLVQPLFVDPTSNSELSNLDAITWDPGDAQFDEWTLSVGSTADAPDDYFQTEVFTVASTNTVIVSGLPTNGEPLYARVQYRLLGAETWNELSETYVAADLKPALTLHSPSTRDRIADNATFEWQVDEPALAQWRLTVADAESPTVLLFDSEVQSDISTSSVTVEDLPSGIVALVTLYSQRTNEIWLQTTSSYVTASDLPDTLLSIDDWAYAGAFALPGDEFGESSLNYAQGVIDVSGDSVFIVGHVYHDAIAEFTIPDLVSSFDVDELNVAASPPVQEFSRVLGGTTSRYPNNLENLEQITGVKKIGDRLLVNAIEYYDAPADNTLTTLLYQQSDVLAESDISEFHAMQGAARAAGWISGVPTEWQETIGAEYLSGFSSGWPIISRLSVGPSLFALDLQLDQLADQSSIIETTELLGFSLDKPLRTDLANEFLDNLVWTHLSTASHGFIVPGTRTYMTVGWTGGHESGVGYKLNANVRDCGGYCSVDPADNGNAFWLWDLDDIQRVKAGALQPHEIEPYAFGPWDLPFQTNAAPNFNRIGGASYDAASDTLYISILEANKLSEYESAPVIVAYVLAPESN